MREMATESLIETSSNGGTRSEAVVAAQVAAWVLTMAALTEESDARRLASVGSSHIVAARR